MEDIANLVKSYSLQGLIRYLSKRETASIINNIEVFNQEDIESLEMWWALSDGFKDLALSCIHSSRSILPASEPIIRQVSDELTGILQIQESYLLQIRSGDTTQFIIEDIEDSWNSENNRALVKILLTGRESLLLIYHQVTSSFREIINERLALIAEALNVNSLKALSTNLSNIKINVYEQRSLAKTKNLFYKKVWQQIQIFNGIKNLDHDYINNLLFQSLLPSLELWRLFEITVIIFLAEAIAEHQKKPYRLNFCLLESKGPIATIDQVEIYWQKNSKIRPYEQLETQEKKLVELLNFLDINNGTPRTDITIVSKKKIISVIECKWFENLSSEVSVLRSACEQLLSYAYDIAFYQNDNPVDIISHSLIALSYRDKTKLNLNSEKINCIGLKDFSKENFLLFIESLQL